MGNSVIGQLRQFRRAKGMTLNDASGAAGVSSPYLSELERGKRKVSLEVIERILAAYDRRLVVVSSRQPQTVGVFVGLRERLGQKSAEPEEMDAEEEERRSDPDNYCTKCGRYSELIERGKCPACFEAWGYT